MTEKRKLNQEEKEEEKILTDLIEEGLPEVSASRKKKLEKAAAKTIARTKPVSIRMPLKELAEIQAKAAEIGMPYQTLINLLVKQYLQGKIRLTI